LQQVPRPVRVAEMHRCMQFRWRQSMSYRHSPLEPARFHRVALATTIAVALGGCMPDPNGPPDVAGLAGSYEMTKANGASLPAPLATSWAEGVVTTGTLTISPEREYWLSFRVRPADGGEDQQFDLHGFVHGVAGAPQIAFFVDDRGNIVFQATYGNVTIEIPTLVEMGETSFRWMAPYMRPA
jgi:hypothetical protein